MVVLLIINAVKILNKIKKSSLYTVSILTLLSGSAVANGMVESIKEQEGWGSYFVRKARNAVKGVGQKVDDKSENIINQIATKAGQEVSQIITNILFKNPDSYGLNHKGRKVPLYNNKLTILNTMFKHIGLDFNKMFDNLPFGVKQTIGLLRPRIETYFAKNLIASLLILSVEEAVKVALLNGYGFSAKQISELMKDTLMPTDTLFTQSTSKIANNVSDFSLILSNLISKNDMDLDDFLDVNPMQNSITLKHVLDQYSYDMTIFFNQQIKNSITIVVELATKEIAKKTYNGIVKVVSTATIATGVVGALIVGPTAPIMMIGTGLLVLDLASFFKNPLINKVSRGAARSVEHYVTNLIPIDHSKDGITSQKVINLGGNAMENNIKIEHDWVDINYKKVTFKDYMAQKIEALELAAQLFQQQYNPNYNPADVENAVTTNAALNKYLGLDDMNQDDPRFEMDHPDHPRNQGIYKAMTDQQFDDMSDKDSNAYADIVDEYNDKIMKENLETARQVRDMKDIQVQPQKGSWWNPFGR